MLDMLMAIRKRTLALGFENLLEKADFTLETRQRGLM